LDDRWFAERITRIEDVVVRALARGTPPTPASLRFLLRRYGASSRDDLADRLGRALAVALGLAASATTTTDRAAWLQLLGEASRVSPDERMPAAVASLVDTLAGEWGTNAPLDAAALAIDACLASAGDDRRAAIVPRAIDELERLASRAYVPGRPVRDAGAVVRLASALLTAFVETARLPYAMLAEELVQTSQRRGDGHADAEAACRAAHVLCRLASLHADADYVNAAVVARGADYRGDGARLLDAHAAHALETPRIAARYGFALAHLLGLH
jgi:hypothetical protein